MAPSFEQLDPETEYDEDEDEVDFSGMYLTLSIRMTPY